MQDVYILEEQYNYEGSEIRGVFSTKANALAYFDRIKFGVCDVINREEGKDTIIASSSCISYSIKKYTIDSELPTGGSHG